MQSEQLGRGFGAQANETVRKILELPIEDLLPTWEAAARRLLAQKLTLDDEINKECGLSVCGPLLVFGLIVLHLCLPFYNRASKSRGRMIIRHLYNNTSQSSIMLVSCTTFSKSMKMESQ